MVLKPVESSTWKALCTFLLILQLCIAVAAHENTCPKAVVGKRGEGSIITCNFRGGFAGIYWFDQTDDDEPLIRIEEGNKVGRGYDNHEYDIFPDGSLEIINVQQEHEQRFKVIFLDADFNDETFYIDFTVTEHHCPKAAVGKRGESSAIICTFSPGFTGIYWFDETDDAEPLIRLEAGKKVGRGYKSGEYDILRNGSLVINNVQRKDEQQFKVLLLDEEFNDETFVISFSVTDNPCPSRREGFYGNEVIFGCHFDRDIERINWYNESNHLIAEDDEYAILENNDLVIRSLQFIHEQKFKVSVVYSEDRNETNVVDVSVDEICPEYQRGLLGEEGVIICHFKPKFRRISWSANWSGGQPFIERIGNENPIAKIPTNKYTITNNGSLRIRHLASLSNTTYTVVVVDVKNNTYEHKISFSVESPCGLLKPPKDGVINQSAKHAIFSCNDGFHLVGKDRLHCQLGGTAETHNWSGLIPTCALSSSPKTTKHYDSSSKTTITDKIPNLISMSLEENTPPSKSEKDRTSQPDADYVGCFMFNGKTSNISFGRYMPKDVSKKSCSSFCGYHLSNIPFTYGLTEGVTCLCDKILESFTETEQLPDEDCQNRCKYSPSDTTYCGSDKAVAVFQETCHFQGGEMMCDFRVNVSAVYWFDDRNENEPFLRVEDDCKCGRGYEDDNYDIFENGSLVIRHAFDSERSYTAKILDIYDNVYYKHVRVNS